MKTIMPVFGTRPEAIKMAPLVKLLQSQEDIRCCVCVTAQHREMLDSVLSIFSITPDHDLNIMRPNQSLSDLTAALITKLSQLMQQVKPDMVLVQGDTTTCFVASLAAFYAHIPVGHVEAGLRTYQRYAPFPEEINRVLTSHLAELHFAPTNVSKANLLKEGVSEQAITVTGNTVIDALLWVRDRVESRTDWGDVFGSATSVLSENKPFILVTGHRRESFGDGFQNICEALATLAERYPDWSIIYPVHLNPNVQEPVKRLLNQYANVHLLKPLEYEPFVYLMNKSYLILTDSGGIQEEAPSLGKPVLVMREVTERPEAVDVGTVLLVGPDKHRIVKNVEKLMSDLEQYRKMSALANPYGDGNASKRIAQAVMTFLAK